VTPPVLFWRQTAGLPELGLPVVAAKLDTGARGTVLHATDISVEDGRVRFTLHPEPGAVLACNASLADMRRVTSSNGMKEARPFIRTALTLGGLPPREVEISLRARHGMGFPMLIGRAALSAWGVLVDPGQEGKGTPELFVR
jgi:hypothetical protein